MFWKENANVLSMVRSSVDDLIAEIDTNLLFSHSEFYCSIQDKTKLEEGIYLRREAACKTPLSISGISFSEQPPKLLGKDPRSLFTGEDAPPAASNLAGIKPGGICKFANSGKWKTKQKINHSMKNNQEIMSQKEQSRKDQTDLKLKQKINRVPIEKILNAKDISKL